VRGNIPAAKALRGGPDGRGSRTYMSKKMNDLAVADTILRETRVKKQEERELVNFEKKNGEIYGIQGASGYGDE